VTTATVETAPRTPASRPNLVSVGTIIWLSSELMFFAALFAMYFTVRSVTKGSSLPWPGAHLNLTLGSINTTVLLLSSVTCQMGVFAVERGQISRTRSLLHPMSWGLREWYVLTFLMGLYFDLGQSYEYYLVAFIFLLGRTYAARTFTHEQQVSAIVVSYYWHFVDVVWIGLFTVIYLIH
jgi:cytochrome c oxidase subunit III